MERGSVEKGIYTGYRVFKDDSDLEYKVPTSFYLDDVCSWEHYAFESNFRKIQGDKIYVELPKAMYIIVHDFDDFTRVMINHNKLRINAGLQ